MIYTIALAETKKKMLLLQNKLSRKNTYDVITNISTRIKKPTSIINKMNKKGYDITYKDLIENINDIAGLRIVCTSEKTVYEIVKEIQNINEINVLKKKDYIKNPKESGYSAYHLIVEVPVIIKEDKIWVKVEIQIRTLAMDFWANIEHKLRYKTENKISKKNSNKLKIYAKILIRINKKMERIYRQNIDKDFYYI
jgi:putative GTP pyrophosphokinase